MTPEQEARQRIDRRLAQSGWLVQDRTAMTPGRHQAACSPFYFLLSPFSAAPPPPFHRPDELIRLARLDAQLRGHLRDMPPLHPGRLWPIQVEAIGNLERSLAADRPRSLIQMATGSGKTFTACSFCYRLIKFARAQRILFLVEQRRIVSKIEELFSDLDAGVAALERAKANLKRYRAAVLKAAVEGKLTEQWRAGHPDVEPASELLKRILTERRRKWQQAQLAKYAAKGPGKKPPKNWKDKYKPPAEADAANLPQLPEGWCWATLSQIGILDRGRSRHRPRNAPHLYGGPYPFVQTGDVRHADTFIRTYQKTYSEKGLHQSKLWREGTLCITIAANIAETAILGFDGCFPDSVVGFLPACPDVSVRYVELFLRTMQSRLESLAPATAQKNINLQTLSQVAICLPPSHEQRQIVQAADGRLAATSRATQESQRGVRRATRLRQAVLKRAFQGELVPQDLEDKSSAAILKDLTKHTQPRKGAERVEGHD